MGYQSAGMKSVYLVVVGMLCVQSGTALAKFVFSSLGASGIVTLRLGLAAIILIILFRVNLFNRPYRDFLNCLPYGISLAGMNLIFYLAIEKIPMGLGTAIEFTGPLTLAVATSRKPQDFLWAVFAGIGIIMITPWTNSGEIELSGVLLAGLAGVFWVGYILSGKKASLEMNPTDTVAIGILIAFLIVLPFGINDGILEKLNLKWLLIGGGVALLTSAIPFSLDMQAFKNIPSKTYSILMSLHPALAAFSGLLFLGERLSMVQAFAVILVVVASMGTAYSSKK